MTKTDTRFNIEKIDCGNFYCNLGFTHDKLKKESSTIVKSNTGRATYNGKLE